MSSKFKVAGLDCVTLDGDQVSSKGSLTGGYFNKSRSRLEMQKTRSEKNEEIQTQENDMKKLRNKLQVGPLTMVNQFTG